MGVGFYSLERDDCQDKGSEDEVWCSPGRVLVDEEPEDVENEDCDCDMH